jgi:hypothetical protein
VGTGLTHARIQSLPYDGPKLYPKVAVKHFLEIGICNHEHIH